MRLSLIALVLCAATCINAVSLTCNYKAGEWAIVGGYCQVKASSAITSPNQTITSITGAHKSGQNDASVTVLHFYSKTVNFVPHGIVTFYPNLEALWIRSCHLKAIEKVDIQNLTILKDLHLFDNDLETLKSGLFDDNTALEFINFGMNPLKSIGVDILKPLNKLATASFYLNTCINKQANTPAELTQLKSELNEKCSNKETNPQ